ncbi:MAG TPA: hypothetical protein VFA43_10640 [Gemmatimonadaceae bacterium]|nr:hypothetical protein [Gemmatimonadaceae bacterium]
MKGRSSPTLTGREQSCLRDTLRQLLDRFAGEGWWTSTTSAVPRVALRARIRRLGRVELRTALLDTLSAIAHGDRSGAAQALVRYADTTIRRRAYASAEPVLEAAQLVLERHDDSAVSYVMERIGLCRRRQGKASTAASYFVAAAVLAALNSESRVEHRAIAGARAILAAERQAAA